MAWLKTLLFFVVIFFILFLFGPFFILSPVKINYQAMEENGITLYYPRNKIDEATRVMKIVQKAGFINDRFFQTKTEPKILLALSDFDMLRFSANPKANSVNFPWGIIIKSSKADYKLITYGLTRFTLQNIFQKNGVILPRWFVEGLVSYLGKTDYYRTLDQLKIDVYEKRYQYDIVQWKGLIGLLKWKNIVFFDPYRSSEQVNSQSYHMTKYLIDKYGQNKINQLFETLKILPFNRAFKQIYELTEEEFADEFLIFLKKE